MIVNNVVALAKGAKAFKVPTILSTVMEERGGYLIDPVQNVFPDQKPINRTTLNAWEDKRVVDAVKKTGRRQLIFAALWTEICLAYPVIHSLGDGYDVFFVTDASGGTTREAHDMAVQRLIQAGATPLTWMGVMTECAGTAVSFGNYSGKCKGTRGALRVGACSRPIRSIEIRIVHSTTGNVFKNSRPCGTGTLVSHALQSGLIRRVAFEIQSRCAMTGVRCMTNRPQAFWQLSNAGEATCPRNYPRTERRWH